MFSLIKSATDVERTSIFPFLFSKTISVSAPSFPYSLTTI